MSSYSAFSGLPLPTFQTFTPNLQGGTSITVNASDYFSLGPFTFCEIDMDFTSSQTYAYFTLPVPVISGTNPFHYALGAGGGGGNVFQAPTVFQLGWNSHTSALDTTLCSVYMPPNFGAWPGSRAAAFSAMFGYRTA